MFISEPNTFAHYNLMRHNSSSQVMKNNAVTDQEKREKKIVVKKLAEMEEELKVRVWINVTKFGTQYYWKYLQLLALSENLTDQVRSLLSFDGFIPIIKTDRFRYFAYIFTFQTLDQLKSDNCRLRDENTALLRVIAKMSKWFKLNAKVRRVVWLLSRNYGVRLPKTFYLARIDEDPLESVSESCGDTDWA